MTRQDGRRSYDAPVVPVPPVPDAGETGVLTLSPTGRRVRLAATGVVLALLLGGTLWGNDSEFPFGPFRMYSTRADPDRPVVSTSVVGVTADGDEVRLSGGEVGLRRAEFEGQLDRLTEQPELLGLLQDVLATEEPVVGQVLDFHLPHLGGRKMKVEVDPIVSDDGAGVLVLLKLEDVTALLRRAAREGEDLTGDVNADVNAPGGQS